LRIAPSLHAGGAFVDSIANFVVTASLRSQSYPTKAIDTMVVTKGEGEGEGEGEDNPWSSVHIVLNNDPAECFHCLVQVMNISVKVVRYDTIKLLPPPTCTPTQPIATISTATRTKSTTASNKHTTTQTNQPWPLTVRRTFSSWPGTSGGRYTPAGI
jgi:hypothetical protein